MVLKPLVNTGIFILLYIYLPYISTGYCSYISPDFRRHINRVFLNHGGDPTRFAGMPAGQEGHQLGATKLGHVDLPGHGIHDSWGAKKNHPSGTELMTTSLSLTQFTVAKRLNFRLDHSFSRKNT